MLPTLGWLYLVIFRVVEEARFVFWWSYVLYRKKLYSNMGTFLVLATRDPSIGDM